MINNSSCVLHCSSVDVEKISAEIKEESQLVITAPVTYMSTIIPLGILPSIFENCLIEYLPIPMPARLMIQAMAKLDEISWCNSDLLKLILGT
uniref:Uncharacterized protein n=1 Tax=Romanomermis culicivorax TaxID=13658 RepID=A0A915J654_ROMCU